MKTLTQIVLLAICLTTAAIATAQNGSQMIKVTVTYNENMPSQAPAVFVLSFDQGGNDALAYPDQGNIQSLGHFGYEVYPFSVSTDQQVITIQDSRSPLSTYRSIPFGFATKDTGDIKVVAELLSSDPFTPLPGFVWLEQVSTGERYSIEDTAKFSLLPNPNYVSDFILHTGPKTYTASTHESCYGMADGSAYVHSPNYAGFTLQFTAQAAPNVPTFTTVVVGTDTTIPNLSPGNYVSVIRINGIPVDSAVITINAAQMVVADFLTDYNNVAPGTTVNFSDYSVGNGISYIWDFGDGDSSTTAGSEAHAYTSTGTYTVNLLVTDVNGCTASTFDMISVAYPPANNNPFNVNNNFSLNGRDADNGNSNTGDPTNSADEDDVNSSNLRIMISSNSEISRLSIVSMNGSVIYSGLQSDTRAEYSVPATGIYVVMIEHTDGTAQSHTVVAE